VSRKFLATYRPNFGEFRHFAICRVTRDPENFHDTKSTSRFRKRSSSELFTQRHRVDFPATSVNAARHCRLSLYGSFHRREILPRCADILAVTRTLTHDKHYS